MIDFSFDHLLILITESTIPLQGLIVILCLLATYFIGRSLNKWFGKHGDNLLRYFGRYAEQVSSLRTISQPLVACLLFSLSAGIVHLVFGAAPILHLASHLALLLIALRTLSILPIHKWLRIGLSMICIATFTLGHFDLLEPSVVYLDQIGLNFAGTKYSVAWLIKTLVTIALIIWVMRILSRKGERSIRSMKAFNADTREWCVKIFEISLYFFSIVFILDRVGVDLTALAMFGGALGVGLGFGLQKIASNFISGMILLFEKPVQINDMVELEGGIIGFVKRLEVQNLLVETLDGREIIVPNEELITKKVTNWTYSSKRARLEVTLSVAYESDLDRVREIMLDSAAEHRMVLQYPQPLCFLREFDALGATFVLFFWIEDVTQGRLGVRSDVMFAVWRRFEAEGISIGCSRNLVTLTEKKAEQACMKL
ncbi:MAG: mechanosensitive ion channel [Chlamydiia bacterium]|nr:mechanosensitive ion channel [Chlamydiia bacterium]